MPTRRRANGLMTEPEGGGTSGAVPVSVPSGNAGTWSLLRRNLEAAGYYLDVLAEGYRCIDCGHPASCNSFRARREELRIGFPELDVVPMWSTMNRNGLVSVAFSDFLIRQVADRLSEIIEALIPFEPSVARKLKSKLDAMIERTAPYLPIWTVKPYPLLQDRFVPRKILESWCTPDGEAVRILSECRAFAGRNETS